MAGNSGMSDSWWLYVLLCANDRLYVGIAKDVDLRFEAHRSGKGAFYTRLNAPLRILARQPQPSRSAALKAEYALKQLSRPQKLSWVASMPGALVPAALNGRKVRK
jgi:putative endonuclease